MFFCAWVSLNIHSFIHAFTVRVYFFYSILVKLLVDAKHESNSTATAYDVIINMYLLSAMTYKGLSYLPMGYTFNVNQTGNKIQIDVTCNFSDFVSNFYDYISIIYTQYTNYVSSASIRTCFTNFKRLDAACLSNARFHLSSFASANVTYGMERQLMKYLSKSEKKITPNKTNNIQNTTKNNNNKTKNNNQTNKQKN